MQCNEKKPLLFSSTPSFLSPKCRRPHTQFIVTCKIKNKWEYKML